MTTQKKTDNKSKANEDTTPAVDQQGEAGAQTRFDGGHEERRNDGLTQDQVTGRAPTGEVAGPIPPLAGEAAKNAPDGRPSMD